MSFQLRPGVRRLFRLAPRNEVALHDDIDEELESLIASRVDDLIAHGMSPNDARAEALRRIGADIDDARRQLHSLAEHRERRMRLNEQIESLWMDLRYAARGLARRPAFTTMAVLTLAIGIGATTAIFSAVNALLLRPLPYDRPDELMKVSLIMPARNERPSRDDMVWSYPKFTAFRDAQKVFSGVALYSANQFTLTGGSDVERISGEQIGATLLRTLGVRVAHGQDLDPSLDAHPGAAHDVLLSERLWQRRFNADPGIVGKTIDIDKEPYTVIGVAPPGFRGLSGQAEVFVPITATAADVLNQAQSHSWWLVGRRAPGVTEEQAAAAVTLLGARVSDAFPSDMDKRQWGAKATPLNDARIAPTIRRSLLVLFGAVGLVLLIACVNVANLLLGRASVRRREIALRLAIGASRKRLVRLLLTESLLLASIGAVASLIVAWAGVKALGTIDPSTTLQVRNSTGLGAIAFTSITLDWSTLAFTTGVAVVVGMLFGLAPAHWLRPEYSGRCCSAWRQRIRRLT